MAIIEQEYKLPDGKGGFNIYHFKTSSKVVKMPDGKTLEDIYFLFSPLESRFKMLWSNYINASDDDIDKILAGTFKPTGSTGDGELNGIPTDSDIDAILNGSYTSHQIVVEDEYCVDVPTDDDIDNILGDV